MIDETEREKKYFAALQEFLITKDRELDIYQAKVLIVNLDIDRQIDRVKTEFKDSSLTERINQLEQERGERFTQCWVECRTRIWVAWRHAEEQGVSKKELLKCFNLADIPVDPAISVSQSEFNEMLDALEQRIRNNNGQEI